MCHTPGSAQENESCSYRAAPLLYTYHATVEGFWPEHETQRQIHVTELPPVFKQIALAHTRRNVG